MPFEVCRVDLDEALPAWPDETAGLISLGGAMHATQTKEYPFLAAEIKLMRRIVHEGGPVWGICLGAQLLAIAAGGDAYRRKHPEVGLDVASRRSPTTRCSTASPRRSSPSTGTRTRASCRRPAHLVATCGDGVQVFRAGGRAWGTQFHPEVDAEMAPHWVRDAVKEQKHLGEAFAEKLRAETDERLPAYPAFCRRITENFVVTAGLLPA